MSWPRRTPPCTPNAATSPLNGGRFTRPAAKTVHAIGSSVLTGSVGDGQITAILDTARSADNAARQAIAASHADIHQTRQSAAADIRTIIADGHDATTTMAAQTVATDNHDGSTAQDVKAILDTAKKDNAMTRSTIVADAQENASIRRTALSEDVAVRQSARAGDISKQEAAQQIDAQRSTAHAEIADNHAQMADAHNQIKATRQQAAQDAAKAVHQGRTGQ